jgi:flagellar biosynthesis protein FlhB
MSEKPDKESKTEPATEKKIRDSVEKGQLPFAKEVPVLGSFFGIIIFAIFFAQSSAFELGRFLAMFLERPDEWSLANANDAVLLYRQVFIEIGKVLGTLMALMVGIGVAASVLQNVPRMVLDRVQPKLSRVSPKEGWSRLFGGKGLAEFVKSIGKLVVAAIILALAMREAQTQLLAGMITQPEAFMLVIREIAIQIILAITVMMIVVAAIDLMWSRYHWHQDLRMTRQEVKDEIKQTDGDPIVKARLRSLQRDRARQRMIASVPRATLVIANPTHYAIALRYVREENAAPIVVAKGQDLLALRIREIAEANGIPVFEEVALARSMYGQVSVDSMIPPQFYQAVAELVRVIYQNKGKQPEGPAR